MRCRINRRQFLQQTTLAGIGFWVAGGVSPAASKSPNEKLNLGVIGVGGRGGHNLSQVAGENIVAMCDIDENYLGNAVKKFPKARTYHDFRKLLDEAKDLDAVVVSTAEHTHAFATLPAIQLGKHVYCEKPLAHTVSEARRVAEAAVKYKVVTQMGTQIHATDNYRRIVELVQANAIGAVRECHVWVARDWGGGERPQGSHPVPPHLHWDLWLGPAPERPYHPAYFPGPAWYKYWDFGGGVLPDLGSHWNDLPFWALKLRHPLTVEAEGPPVSPETAPPWIIVRWEFAARGDMPPVKLAWYQGGKKPALVADGKVPTLGSGVLFVGGKGMLLCDYGKHLLLPEADFKDYKRPEPSIPKSIGHHAEWINACKTGGATTCPFDYSGALTESNILGNVAYRVGQKLDWDPLKLVARNCPEADKYLRKEYRKGWQL